MIDAIIGAITGIVVFMLAIGVIALIGRFLGFNNLD